jgi:hypothetical protein
MGVLFKREQVSAQGRAMNRLKTCATCDMHPFGDEI